MITERINLREQVVWCHPPNDEDTQMLAEDYMRMGITKTNKYEDRPPFMEASEKGILVIGGGMTGMTAAVEAAAAGYQVYLVEKEPQLGGWANKFSQGLYGKAAVRRDRGLPVQDEDRRQSMPAIRSRSSSDIACSVSPVLPECST